MPTPPTMPEIAAALADVQLTRESGGDLAAVVTRHPALAALLPATPPPAVPAPVPTVVVHQPAPLPAARPWGQYLAVGAGAAAVLLPVLMTVTALLIALGLAALAMAVMTLVLRWIIRDIRRG
jgi:hypothetical protein